LDITRKKRAELREQQQQQQHQHQHQQQQQQQQQQEKNVQRGNIAGDRMAPGRRLFLHVSLSSLPLSLPLFLPLSPSPLSLSLSLFRSLRAIFSPALPPPAPAPRPVPLAATFYLVSASSLVLIIIPGLMKFRRYWRKGNLIFATPGLEEFVTPPSPPSGSAAHAIFHFLRPRENSREGKREPCRSVVTRRRVTLHLALLASQAASSPG